MFLQNILHVRMAQRLGKPVVFFPQSFGPVFSSTGRRWLRDILSHETTHKIFARENRSFSYAARLLGSGAAASKLELCPDLAFTLEPGPPPLSPEGFRGLPRPIVALTLRSWDFPHTRGGGKRDARMTRYLDALELACRHIGRELGGSLLVFPQARGPGAFENDRIVSQQLHERLKPHLPEDHMCFLDPPAAYAPDRIMEALSHADLLIATRFHSAIFALLVRTPVVSIAYQPKASGMMEMLGLADHTLDAAELKPEEIIASIESILSDPSGYMGRAAAGIAALKNDAEERIRAGLSPFLEKSSS
jgi:colanic acid/amylovoran biosynthesis protein